jgi:hypothetical protein
MGTLDAEINTTKISLSSRGADMTIPGGKGMEHAGKGPAHEVRLMGWRYTRSYLPWHQEKLIQCNQGPDHDLTCEAKNKRRSGQQTHHEARLMTVAISEDVRTKLYGKWKQPGGQALREKFPRENS